MSKVEPWCKACGEGELPSELQDLEDTIHHHQGLYEHISTAYSEVSDNYFNHISEIYAQHKLSIHLFVENKCIAQNQQKKPKVTYSLLLCKYMKCVI